MADSTEGKVSAIKRHRQKLTDSIIEALQAGEGELPWNKPWNSASFRPFNPVTKTRFKGGNLLALLNAQQERESADPRWLTLKQINKAGLKLQKGAKGVTIEYWLDLNRLQADKAPEKEEDDPDLKPEVSKTHARPRLVGRYYTVFNGEDIEGLPPLEVKPREFKSNALAERLVQATGADIEHAAKISRRNGFSAELMACYSPHADKITMPPRAAFDSEEDYYATLIHELGHWTGHPDRLARFKLDALDEFGSPGYAEEELRAELTAWFMRGALGIEGQTQNHVSYLGAWLEKLQNNHSFIYDAARHATAMSDYLIDQDPALRAEIEALIDDNTLTLKPEPVEALDAEVIVETSPLPAFDTSNIVVQPPRTGRLDPRWPGFEDTVRQGAARFGVGEAQVQEALAMQEGSFSVLMDELSASEMSDADTVTLVARSIVRDLRDTSEREKRWQHFDAKVHEVADARFGAEAVSARLAVLREQYHGILAEGTLLGIDQALINDRIALLLYGEQGRRPVDEAMIDRLMLPAQRHEGDDDFELEAGGGEGISLIVEEDDDDELVLMGEDASAEIDFMDDGIEVR